MNAVTSVEETLRCIRRTGQTIANVSGTQQSPCRTYTPSFPTIATPDIHLPDPPPIHHKLTLLGLPPSVSEDLSLAYLSNATKLQHSANASIRQLSQDLADLPNTSALATHDMQKGLIRAYRNFYLRALEDWTKKVVDFATSRRSSANGRSVTHPPTTPLSSSHLPNERRPFNQDYLPVLEHFFEDNAYPSHTDKVMLANKTGMEYRQIHIWFQNHRRRLSKVRPVLRKKPGQEPPRQRLDDLEIRLPGYIVPEDDRVEIRDSDNSEICSSDEDESTLYTRHRREPSTPDIVAITTSPHAFPATYPPPVDAGLFPKDGIFKFPPPIWARQPATKPIKSTCMGMDELANAFQVKLSLMVSSKEQRKQPRKPRKLVKAKDTSLAPKSAATVFVTTRPPCGRHPAFIPSQAICLSTRTPPLRAVPARTSRALVFPTPSPQSKKSTLLSFVSRSKSTTSSKKFKRKLSPLPSRTASGAHSDQSNSMRAAPEATPSEATLPKLNPAINGGRKVAPLPRRSPTGRSRARRGASPSTSDASSPSYESSYNSDSTSTTRISSSSSSSSSTVVTPKSSPLVLPEPIHIAHCETFSDPKLSLPGFNFCETETCISELFTAAPLPGCWKAARHAIQ